MEEEVSKVLGIADIKVNGSRPWDVKINNPKLYSRMLSGGTLALGESYMDGWWDSEKLDQLITKIFLAKLDENPEVRKMLWKHVFVSTLKAKAINMQTKSRAYKVGEQHYDVGNDLYSLMLDKQMNYSCGYWKDAKNLDEAQEAKMDLCCKKLGLKPGMTVLDIGCGWGSFARFAAKKYKVKVLGITISKEQVKLARERCKGLPVEIRLQDYRNLNEKFDRIISIGMFEHVGYKNYKTYMEVANRCLKDDGLFLLHTIGRNISGAGFDPWIEKYIFPNSMLPSPKQIASAAEGLFAIEDWHNFGPHYDKTLMAWHANFTKNWDKIKDKYSERFYRKWNFYLLCCAACFRARRIHLWQVVLSKNNSPRIYESMR